MIVAPTVFGATAGGIGEAIPTDVAVNDGYAGGGERSIGVARGGCVTGLRSTSESKIERSPDSPAASTSTKSESSISSSSSAESSSASTAAARAEDDLDEEGEEAKAMPFFWCEGTRAGGV